MPNWCSNHLFIRGTNDELNAIRTLLEGKDEVLDFEKVKPTPLDDGIVDVKELSDEDFDWTSKDSKKPDKTLFPGWYEFRIAEWGTKWNASDPVLEDQEADRLVYTFDTAWSPPSPIVLKLSELFPEAEFALSYFEPGCGFAGTYSACNGVDSNNMYDYGSVEYTDMASSFGFREIDEDDEEE